MNTKQQKQIKEFLLQKFGNVKGNEIFSLQEKSFDRILQGTSGKTKSQMRTLVQTILPRIALYKALKESGLPENEVRIHMQKYMLGVVAAKKHAAIQRMEIFPGFYAVYSKIFLKIMRTTDLQESTQKSEKNFYDITITRCLWHTACAENGCPELCGLFCDVDDVTYGGLKKIGFSRTKTLGRGGDCCDFHFFKK